ncbi:hypothetical protein BGW36DRAFT_376496 [Talaromyces proteolyticus]|uniref:ribonuclease Z n=1 Tax=Talaromyces proteolyticus TaxID=1131652 RepID=A0AAD4Q1E2_9EURO|nr:uncharacterized protein BGW36DRAFT_376496 [Talaromyces proteolyticus]KAH8698624.1 hypothetical protein BGW36DRAFT_376496 [Talaromyces proteolyticus]
MKYYYQVLSTPTADSPGSTFILNYPNRKYLFGHVAEGTQRLFSERTQSHSYLTEFFITGKTAWNTNGGVLGMVLTMADARAASAASMALENEEKRNRRLRDRVARGLPPEPEPEIESTEPERLTIHGSKNLNHTLSTARRFIFRKSFPVKVQEYDAASLASARDQSAQSDAFEFPTWSDENIKVWAMPLRPSYEKSFKNSVSGFGSPRKRSLNEFEEREGEQVEGLDPKAKDDMLRESIVKDMFDSQWTLDSLTEHKLANVTMPATIFVRNPVTKDLERYNGPLPGGDEAVPDIKVFVRKPWPAATVDRLPPTTPATESMCYIVRGHDQRGKFDPKKAIEAGVPKGRAFGDLTNGISYTTEDGRVVTPEMVLGPHRPGKGVAFIDIPSREYIDDFISRAEWQSKAVTSGLSVFFWILGPGVGEDRRILDFVARMKGCEHIVSSTDHCPNYLAMKTAAMSSLRLARINSDNFQVPVHDNHTLPQTGTRRENESISIEKKAWRTSELGLIVDMEPKFSINETEVVNTLNPLQFISRIPRAAEQRLKIIQQRLRKPHVIHKVMEMRDGLPPLAEEAEVFTLGTGSSTPSKHRNVSATLLHVPGKGYYLFDCGENTLGQLKRSFAPDELREVMENLRVIWISHLHADHHLGTVSVIKEWYKVNYQKHQSGSMPKADSIEDILRQKRLCVISDGMFIQWLEEYAGVEEFGFDMLLPLSASPYLQSGRGHRTSLVYRHCRPDGTYPDGGPSATTIYFDQKSHLTELLQKATGLKNFGAVHVIHCKGAMAVTFEWEQGFKVSYSGDCRPSVKFAQLGKNSTLLIHEATFENDMVGSAIAKKHSTAAEAIEIGRRMNARMLLLTHFSQRYAKLSRVDPTSRPTAPPEGFIPQQAWQPDVAPNDADELGEDFEQGEDDITLDMAEATAEPPAQARPIPTCAGFDYMRVKIRDIPIAQMFAPAFERLVQRLDQASVEEAEKEKQKREGALTKNPKYIAKMKAKQKWSIPAEAAAAQAEDQPAKPSAWSASESESGWSDADSEGENEKENP